MKKITRPLSDRERLVCQTRTPIDEYRRVQDLHIFVNDTMQMPAVMIDLDLIPLYPLLTDGLHELLSSETLLQLVYFCQETDGILPSGVPISEQVLLRLKHVLCSMDERQNVLAVKWKYVHKAGRCMATYGNFTEMPPRNAPVGSFLGVSKQLRSTLFQKHGYVDIDQAKSHPTLLAISADLFALQAPCLREYLDHPEILQQSVVDFIEGLPLPRPNVSLSDVKSLVTQLTYGSAIGSWYTALGATSIPPLDTWPASLLGIHDEARAIAQVVKKSNRHLVNEVGLDEFAIQSKVLSRFLGTIENFITYCALDLCITEGVIPFRDGKYEVVWGFDGFSWIHQAETTMENLVTQINDHVIEQCGEAFSLVKFINKAIPANLLIPEVMDENHDLWLSNEFHNFGIGDIRGPGPTISEQIHKPRTFAEMRLFFESELGHFKVHSTGKIGREVKDPATQEVLSVEMMSSAECRAVYEHLIYLEPDPKIAGLMLRKQFISAWLSNTKPGVMRIFKSALAFPPGAAIPAQYNLRDNYNTWTNSPWHGSKLRPGEVVDNETIQLYTDAWKAMCGYTGRDWDQLSLDEQRDILFPHWVIAHAIQRPFEKPGVAIVLMGSEGAGKTITTDITMGIIGRQRCVATSLRDVAGQFNSILDGKFLVVINELTDCMDGEVQANLKRLITDTSISINGKGDKQYNIESYHRIIATTNDPCAIPSDRRPHYYRCDLSLYNNEAAIRPLLAILNSPKKLATLYRHYATMDLVEMFGGTWMKPPNNELNRNIRALRNPWVNFTRFLMEFEFAPLIANNQQHVDILISALHTKYNAWKEKYSVGGSDISLYQLEKDYIHGAMSWEHNTFTRSPIGRHGYRFDLLKIQAFLNKINPSG